MSPSGGDDPIATDDEYPIMYVGRERLLLYLVFESSLNFWESLCEQFDGRTPGFAQPSSTSQETLIRACHISIQLADFGYTTFVECHGIGTATGDPIEASAATNVFGEKGVYIGSVEVSG